MLMRFFNAATAVGLLLFCTSSYAEVQFQTDDDTLIVNAHDMLFNTKDYTKQPLNEMIRDIKQAVKDIADLRDDINFLDTRGKEALVCDSGHEGEMRVVSGELQICHQSKWNPSYQQPLGYSRSNPAEDCQEMLTEGMLNQGTTIAWFRTQVALTGGDSSDAELEHVHQGACEWDGGDTVTDLGGDGQTQINAALSCAEIRSIWSQPTGIYWVAACDPRTSNCPNDDELIFQETSGRVYCKDGEKMTGDGTGPYDKTATSCDAIIDDFQVPLLDENGDHRYFWVDYGQPTQILGPSCGVPGISAVADVQQPYSNTGSNGQAVLDGNFNTIAHGDNSKVTDASLHISLNEGPFEIQYVDVVNRKGTCGQRSFYGTGCGSGYLGKTYAGENQGFNVYISESPCSTDSSYGTCDEVATLCGRVTKANTGDINSESTATYRVTCPPGTWGQYITIILPGYPRMLNLAEVRAYATQGPKLCHSDKDGSSKENAGLACSTIKAAFPNLHDGVYWLKPNTRIEAFQNWCDMTRLGGGWSLTDVFGTKWDPGGTTKTKDGDVFGGAGPRLGMYSYLMLKRGGNLRWNEYEANGKIYPAASNAYDPKGVYSIGQERTNAIWGVRKTRTVFRWTTNRNRWNTNCMDTFQQRLNVPDEWDAFTAIRDARLFGDGGSNYASSTILSTGYEREQFRMAYSGKSYNSNIGDCLDESKSLQYYDKVNGVLKATEKTKLTWWDVHTHPGQRGTPDISVTRHGGFMGDAWGGCGWAYKFNSASSQTVCRTDVMNFIYLK